MPARILVFTDLDGTLLDPETYENRPALEVLTYLKSKKIPLIPTTSKTRAEVEAFRRELGLTDPFIVENGSAVFVPIDYPELPTAPGVEVEGYRMYQLGCTYEIARQGLRHLSEDLGVPLRGFGDMDLEEVQKLTGLSVEAAKRAMEREFSEPFLTPPEHLKELLHQSAKSRGFRVVQGDRFSHLIGLRAGKGPTVRILIQLFKEAHPGQKVVSIGLGNSPNDKEFLEAVDLAIVIPGKEGPHPELQRPDWHVAPSPGPAGWAAALKWALDALNLSNPEA